MFVPAMTVCVPATSSSAPSASQTFPASSRRSVQLTYATAATLPEAESLYTYGFLETEALKKEFSKPRHHKTITTNKNPGIQKILGILAKKQPATVLLTFKHSASVSSQLHLAFAFAPKLSLTITSKNPLENWQKELINTLIKKDSFWVRHPFGVASGVSFMSLAMLVGVHILYALKLLQGLTLTLFAENFLAYKKEFFFEILSPKKIKFKRNQAEPTGSTKVLFDVSKFEIPQEATVACIAITQPGIVTALIQGNKLTNKNDMQLRIIIVSGFRDEEIFAELEQHKDFLKENNCLFFNHDSHPVDGPTHIAKLCEDFFNEKFTCTSEGERQISQYETELEKHLGYIEDHLYKPNHLIYFPKPAEGWYMIGDPDTAEIEMTIFPISAYNLCWQNQSWRPNLYNVPCRQANIKKSIICVINDTSAPYIFSGQFSTKETRLTYNRIISFRPDGPALRFDDFFVALEPTSYLQTRFLHYIASEPIGGNDAACADEANDTNNTIKLFSTQEPTTTLELTYQAAAAYIHRTMNSSEASSGDGFSMSNIHFGDDGFNATTATSQAAYENALIKGRVSWADPALDADAFRRFERDVLACLAIIDPAGSKFCCSTSSEINLSQVLASLPHESSNTEYNLIFADSKLMGSINARSQLNTTCANKGWQIVVFGQTKLSHNNNRFYVNFYLDAVKNNYVITTTSAEPLYIVEYKDAILKIAKALQVNRRQMQSDQQMQKHWEYSIQESNATLGGGEPVTCSTPLIRRTSGAEECSPVIREKTTAQSIFESLQLTPNSAWCPSFQASENACYDTTVVIGIELNNLSLRANIIFANKRLKPRKKYVIFSTANQETINSFFKQLTTDAKKQIFIISNYNSTVETRNSVTITRASGPLSSTSTHQITLKRLSKILE